MDIKVKDKIIKNIKWSKSVQGGWQGSFTLSDGYCITMVGSYDMKMREAKAHIKDVLPQHIEEAALERNVPIFKN